MRERRGRAALCIAAAGALSALACSWLPFAPRALRACPGELRPAAEADEAFVARARMRVRGDGVDVPLQVVVQQRPGERIVVGFDPLGAKLFTVVQRGDATEVDALPAAVLPVPPLNVVRDLHRGWLWDAGPPPAGSDTATAVFGGLTVRDTWSGGALARRRFEPSGATVEFGAGGSLHIEHPACGYAADVETLTREPL